MSDSSAIEWTDATWNPSTGCTKISPGCLHCYIDTTPPFRMAGRKFVHGKTDLQLHLDRLDKPLHWRKPKRVFVNSLSDLFHEDVSDEFIAAVFGVMCACPKHTFQVLTKRAQRMHDWVAKMNKAGGLGVYIRCHEGRSALRGLFDSVARTETVNGEIKRRLDDPWMQVMNGAGCNYGPSPLWNVWLGVSCEDQQRADERIPWLLKTPAAVRFVSAEPLLGPLQFTKLPAPKELQRSINGGLCYDALKDNADRFFEPDHRLGWVIVGGESGPGARPCRVEWILSIVEQCKAAGVACFVKQVGSHPVARGASRGDHYEENDLRKLWRMIDKKGGDMAEWPEALRVREYPSIPVS
jgi:protein gp37